MKILLMDESNIADALSQVLCREGHDLYASNSHFGTRRWGTKTIGYREDLSNAIGEQWDLVIACGTNTNRDGQADRFREIGVPVVGAGEKGFRLEEKHLGRKAFQEAGLRCPVWRSFEHNTEAIAFLKTCTWTGVVVKFTETNRPFRTTVCQDLIDAVFTLERVPDGEVVLEELVEGEEIAMACYFDGHKFIPSVTTLEHKHLWPGKRGVLTPEMGTLVFYDPTPKWIEAFNSLLVSPTAREHLRGYRGFIDINAIADKDGYIVPLEFTCRFGVPQTDIMSALLKREHSRYGEFLLGVAKGDADPSLLCHSDKFAVGANLVICGYPYHEIYPDICHTGSPIRGWESLTSHFTFGVVGEQDGVLTTLAPWVMCVTGVGDTLAEARAELYLNANRVSFQDMIFRDDIGSEFNWVRDRLAKKGMISQERANQ